MSPQHVCITGKIHVQQGTLVVSDLLWFVTLSPGLQVPLIRERTAISPSCRESRWK